MKDLAHNQHVNKSILKKIDYLTWRMHHNLSRAETERWLKAVFYNLVGYMPNLKNPKTFNEKLCWYRLNYDHEDIKMIVDKIEFKKYIKNLLGDDLTTSLYGVYNDEWDIPFDKLPNQFVLKSSLSSAANNILFVEDKNALDIDKTLYTVSEWLQPWNSSSKSFSNWFKGIEPRILAEEYLKPKEGDLIDYKFLCFNGIPDMLFTVSERTTNKYLNFYDLSWNLLPLERKFKNSPHPIDKPSQFDLMIELAKKLSKPFPFVRVDFYEVKKRIYIGELTFSPGGGLEPFTPKEWDRILGDKFQLPG